MDHIDQVDLLELADDLGCISAEEQSFTFKPASSTSKTQLRSDQKKSNGLTFSDQELDIDSNFDGNIVCKKFKEVSKQKTFADGCSGSYHH